MYKDGSLGKISKMMKGGSTVTFFGYIYYDEMLTKEQKEV